MCPGPLDVSCQPRIVAVSLYMRTLDHCGLGHPTVALDSYNIVIAVACTQFIMLYVFAPRIRMGRGRGLFNLGLRFSQLQVTSWAAFQSASVTALLSASRAVISNYLMQMVPRRFCKTVYHVCAMNRSHTTMGRED